MRKLKSAGVILSKSRKNSMKYLQNNWTFSSVSLGIASSFSLWFRNKYFYNFKLGRRTAQMKTAMAYILFELDPKITNTVIDVKTQYKKLILKYHPDKNGNSQFSTSAFKIITSARDVILLDIERRKANIYTDIIQFGKELVDFDKLNFDELAARFEELRIKYVGDLP